MAGPLNSFVIAGAFVALTAVSFDALAQNAHFVGSPTTRCSGSTLLISFKVAGLGQGQSVEVSASDSAVVQCVNRGGNPPPGQRETVSASGTFGPASKSGNIRGTLALSPQNDCPDHMTQTATYTGITLATEDGDTVFLAGPITCSG